MKYPTIRIEGPIISPETLDKLSTGDAAGQRSAEFGLDATSKVKDEIAATWAEAQAYWRSFQRKTEGLKPTDTGTTEVRKFWIAPLLALLGYDLETGNSEIVNGQSYAISHRGRGGFPVHIIGYQDYHHKAPEERSTLDIKPSNATRRMSPHALVQEYINLKEEHTYAIISNGLQLRLLRDSSRLTRLSFVEWNLEQMMDEEVFADFALLYRLLHATRMPAHAEDNATCFIEQYHQNALEGGSRIREGLSDAVKSCIVGFANGFLQHKNNDALRKKLQAGGPEMAKEYFGQQLRLIYRLLFLMVIEERDLIYAKGADKTKRDIYYSYYSLQRLRRLAEKLYLRDARHHDSWDGLQQIFSLFEAPLTGNNPKGEALGVAPLGGDLFSHGALSLLQDCTLSNKVLLECLNSLSVFTHKETKARIRVNYASLNVEEFGSVYEGLLEYDAVIDFTEGLQPQFRLVKGNERSSSGSHYTPDELVQPLIKHSLEYLIEDKLKEPDPVAALLSLKVCDIACGSGHILLSAARRIAVEVARKQHNEEQPSPAHLREATREVIKRCIYGVDKNPLAVELCKVALWLEAHNPGEPLHFLDHHIKCGDAIVGLAHREELERGIADEAFKVLPGDEKVVATAWKAKNSGERKAEAKKSDGSAQLSTAYNEADAEAVKEYNRQYAEWLRLPECTAADVAARQRTYAKLQEHRGHGFEQTLANAQVAQFFIPKTAANKDRLLAQGDYRQMLRGYKSWQGPQTAMANAVAEERRFFHWFLEFPEVDAQGGFDCVLGNPPYLGGKKLSGSFGNAFLNWLLSNFYPAGGQSDLIIYFLKRIFSSLSPDGQLAIITTNTISQGDTREFGLDELLAKNAEILFALPSIKWIGTANLEVTLISISKRPTDYPKILGANKVKYISSFLDEDNNVHTEKLKSNSQQSFKGSYIGGLGFTMSIDEAVELIKSESKYKQVVFPYLTGGDLNDDYQQRPSRWVINFFTWPIEKARMFTICFEIVEHLVKPERANANRQSNRDNWWIYAEDRPGLYGAISQKQRVLAVSQVTKYLVFSFVNTGLVFDTSMIIFPFEAYLQFVILQSSVHETWGRKFSSTLESRLRYTPTDAFETFPFPQNLNKEQQQALEIIGERYHEHRRHLMLAIQLGLTKTYNLFHSRELHAITPVEDALEDKAFAKAFGKDAAHLHRHLRATPGTIPFNEAVQRIEALRALHVEIDAAVLASYDWQALPLRPDFYEVDYLPEGDRIRYTIHPDARKEVLKRLLELNHQIHAEEMAVAEANKLVAKKPKATTKKTDKAQLSLAEMGRPRSSYDWMYSHQDVVRITGIHEDTVRRWLRLLHDRYQYEGVKIAKDKGKTVYLLNFYSIHEIIVFADLRRNRIKLGEMMNAREWLREHFAGDVPKGEFYPYTNQRVLETIGKAGSEIIFTDPTTGDQRTLGKGGNVQLNLHVLQGILNNVLYDRGMISRLYLGKNGKNGFTAIDPTQASGKPCIVTDDGGVSIDTIKSDYAVAQDVAVVAKRWRIKEDAVLEALGFEKAIIFSEN